MTILRFINFYTKVYKQKSFHNLMKKAVSMIMVFTILALVVNVFAYESTISVQTGHPDTLIILKVADPDTGKTLPEGTFTETTDEKGEVIFNYNLEPIRIKMGFMAQQDNGAYLTFLNEKESIFIPNLILNKFVDINLNTLNPTVDAYSGEEINETETNRVEVAVNVSDEEEPEEIVEESEVVEETKESGMLTGFSIKDTTKSVVSSKITYYVLGGFLIALMIIFVAKKKLKSRKGGTYIDFKVKPRMPSMNKDDELADAEKKLGEAKEELDDIKNRKGKLEETKKRFEKDKAELEKLEKED